MKLKLRAKGFTRAANAPPTGEPAGKFAPSAAWQVSGNIEDGGWPSGVFPFAAQTDTRTSYRAWGSAPKPTIRPLFPDRLTIDADFTIAFLAEAEGREGGPTGVNRVELLLEGSTLPVTQPSIHDYLGTDGLTYSDKVYAATLDHAAIMAMQGTNLGFMRLYARVVANDPSMADRIVGPYLIAARPQRYDATVYVTPSAITDSPGEGGVFTTIIRALNWLTANNKKHAKISLTESANYPGTINKDGSGATSVAVAQLSAKQWHEIIAPHGVTAYLGDGLNHLTLPANGVSLRHDGLWWQNIIIDPAHLGAGYGQYTPFGTGSVIFANCEITQGAATVANGGNTLAGQAATHNWRLPNTAWCAAGANVSFLECNLHDITYGYCVVGTTGAQLVRNSRATRCPKPAPGARCVHGLTVTDAGAFHSPHLMAPPDGLAFYYNGAGVAHFDKIGLTGLDGSGLVGAEGSLRLFEDSNSAFATMPISAATLPQAVADFVNSHSARGFSAVNLAGSPETSPATVKSAVYLHVKGNAQSLGVPKTQIPSTGLVLELLVDVHADALAYSGSGGQTIGVTGVGGVGIAANTYENVWIDKFKVINNRGGQLIFTNRDLVAQDWFIGRVLGQDRSTLADPARVSPVAQPSSFNCPSSNVVIRKMTTDGFPMRFGATYLPDEYCLLEDVVATNWSWTPKAGQRIRNMASLSPLPLDGAGLAPANSVYLAGSSIYDLWSDPDAGDYTPKAALKLPSGAAVGWAGL